MVNGKRTTRLICRFRLVDVRKPRRVLLGPGMDRIISPLDRRDGNLEPLRHLNGARMF